MENETVATICAKGQTRFAELYKKGMLGRNYIDDKPYWRTSCPLMVERAEEIPIPVGYCLTCGVVMYDTLPLLPESVDNFACPKCGYICRAERGRMSDIVE